MTPESTGQEKLLARKRYQQGQLFLRGKRTQVWIGRWREYVIENGQQKAIHRSERLGTKEDFPTKRMAMRELEERMRKVNATNIRKPTHRITLREVAQKWQDTVLPTHKPSTQNSCRAHVKWFLGELGDELLSDISVERLQQFAADPKVNPKTLRNRLGTLRMVWNSAKAWGYVSHNPFEGLRLPQLRPSERPCFTPEQMTRIIEVSEEPWKSFFWLAAETGMRVGELCGLRTCDVDCGECVVRVRQSVWRGKTGTPKSARGVRTFCISPRLAAHLGAYKNQWCQGGPGGNGEVQLMFHTRCAKAWDSRFVVRRLQATLAALGFPLAGMHAFRHGNATMMVANGVDIKTAQKRLGHADISMTAGIYAHAVADNDRRTAEMIGEILSDSYSTGPKIISPPPQVVEAEAVSQAVCA